MATELLVEDYIEDGQKLLYELVLVGFDVTVAFWAKEPDRRYWTLYIGSKSVDSGKLAEGIEAMYSSLAKLPNPAVDFSSVRLIPASSPIAVDALAARNRRPGRRPVMLYDQRLGNMLVDEAHIYPPVGGPMAPDEILQTLVNIANRPGGNILRPVTITLRDGQQVTAQITGFRQAIPGSLTIQTLDPDSNLKGEIEGDEVVAIEL